MQVEQLAVALERLTGAVEGANMCDNCVVYEVLEPCMEPMLVVQRAFRHHELITRILFALAAAMAREHSGEVRREGGLLGAEVCAATLLSFRKIYTMLGLCYVYHVIVSSVSISSC